MNEHSVIALMAAVMAHGMDPKIEIERRQGRAEYYVSEAVRFYREARRQCSALSKAGYTPEPPDAVGSVPLDEVRAFVVSMAEKVADD